MVIFPGVVSCERCINRIASLLRLDLFWWLFLYRGLPHFSNTNITLSGCFKIEGSLQVHRYHLLIAQIREPPHPKKKKGEAVLGWERFSSFRGVLYPDTEDQCSQLIVATLVPSTPLCLFFNLAKLQCKQTVVTDFCIGFVNKIHIIGKGMIKETWISKIKEIGYWTEELITFCPFLPVSMWSKELPNFAVNHVDLSWDFGHDVPCMGRRIDVNNEGDLDTRLYWQIEPGVFLA